MSSKDKIEQDLKEAAEHLKPYAMDMIKKVIEEVNDGSNTGFSHEQADALKDQGGCA